MGVLINGLSPEKILMGRKVRILHIINSFQPGGAEAMLCRMLERMDRNSFDPYVVSLIDDLRVAGPVIKAGIPLKVMDIEPGKPDPRGPMRLVKYLNKLRPDIVQTWMDHSNLIGGVAARRGGLDRTAADRPRAAAAP